ncbi:pilin [Microgenomates group bacterium]|nr:pilin [Microgenomates group bacterium]
MFITKVIAQTKEWRSLQQETNYPCVSGITDDIATIQGVTCLIANAASIVFTLVGFAGFLMLVVGGIRFMLSGGTAQSIQQSTKTVTGAVIGLVLALSSFLIVTLISQFTGVNLGTIIFEN